MMPARCSKPTEESIRERPETRQRRTMSKSNPKLTPIFAASTISRPRATTWHIRFWRLADMPRVVASNIKRKGPAQTPGLSLCVEYASDV